MINNKKETGKKLHPRESFKEKTITDQKEHKGSSQICQQNKTQQHLDDPQDF